MPPFRAQPPWPRDGMVGLSLEGFKPLSGDDHEVLVRYVRDISFHDCEQLRGLSSLTVAVIPGLAGLRVDDYPIGSIVRLVQILACRKGRFLETSRFELSENIRVERDLIPPGLEVQNSVDIALLDLHIENES